MVRPREFDFEQVLDKAMYVFWEKGYKATSLQDLLKAMALSKSSFYGTFDSKQDLFIKALDRFHKKKAIYVVASRDPHLTAKEAINDLFNVFIDGLVTNRLGCMFAKNAMEYSILDRQLMEPIAKGINHVKQTFYEIVKRGQRSGEINNQRSAWVLASSLTATFYGLQVMASTHPDKVVLQDIASQAIATLNEKN